MRNYCTYFDHRYLPQGLALYSSLANHAAPFQLTALALNEECEKKLINIGFENIKIVSLHSLIKTYPVLETCQKNRSLLELYFTCTPFLIKYEMKNLKKGEAVTYLDSDCFFFSSPESIHENEKSFSIGITPHRFTPSAKNREKYGIYNVGWVTFRNDEIALNCLEYWSQQCADWCYDKLEPERFGDQKYLDTWPKKYKNVKIHTELGINSATWNIGDKKISKKNKNILINNDKLIFYHFHGWSPHNKQKFKTDFSEFLAKAPKNIQLIYNKYHKTIDVINKAFNLNSEIALKRQS